MAYDPLLADEVRAHLGNRPDITEREMFGGIAFMVNGNMAVGVSGGELMVRVGKENHEVALSHPGTRTFDMGARPMRGWVMVSGEGLVDDADLAAWIDRGLDHARTLPAK